MSQIAREISTMVDMLPEDEQSFAFEFIKKLVHAWDPDFTKTTSIEKERLKQADVDFDRGETISGSDIDWD